MTTPSESKAKGRTRPNPTRQKPIRKSTGVFRNPDPSASTQKSSPRPAPISEDAVIRTVQIATRIADEQIKRGQDWARRLRTNSGAPRPDVSDVIETSVRLFRDLTVLLVELAESGVQLPTTAVAAFERFRALNTLPAVPAQAAAPLYSPTPQPSAPSLRCPLEVDADNPVRIEVELTQALDDFQSAQLTAFPLYAAASGQILPLSIAESGGSARALKLVVKNAQAGTYTGVVRAANLREPIAYINVEVLAKP